MKTSVIRHCRAAATSFVVAAAALAAAADPATNAVVKIPMEAFAKDADWKSFVPAGFTVSPSDAHAELGHAWMLSLKHVFVCYADDRYYYFGDAFFREPSRERVLRSNCKVDGRTGEIPDRPPSATVGDWTLSVRNGNTGEAPALRLVRRGEPVDWQPPERLAALVAGTGGKFAVSPFRGILGFDGFRIDALSGTTGSRLSCYLAVKGDDLVPVADSFGDPGDEDHAVDLDGDGVDELVCDVTWEMGGHPRVHLFRRMDDVSMLCDDPTPLLPEPASSLAWAGHLRERYDPKTKTIRIRYLPERRVRESPGSIGEEMYEEIACPILLERLSWHPATNAPAAPASHAESAESAE